MNESLKKILSVSSNGYINDLNEAERIISDLLELTSAELDPDEESCILQNIEIYLDLMKLTDVDKEEILCGEFLGILDSFTIAPFDDGDKNERPLVIRRTLYNLLGALRDNIGKNDTIKLFKAVTVESYFECASRRAGKRGFEVFELYQKFRYIFQKATDYPIDKETTIADFFDEVFRLLNIRWDILYPIEKYGKMILTVHDAIYCFFVENIQIGFPQYFNKIEFFEKKAEEDRSADDMDDDLFSFDNDEED